MGGDFIISELESPDKFQQAYIYFHGNKSSFNRQLYQSKFSQNSSDLYQSYTNYTSICQI